MLKREVGDMGVTGHILEEVVSLELSISSIDQYFLSNLRGLLCKSDSVEKSVLWFQIQ